MMDEESLIKQQIEYYRARVPEYEEWFYRTGRYDRGDENKEHWFAELASVCETLESSNPNGNILELACGTGLWTKRLVQYADRLVAVDVSQEAIQANRRQVADERVLYITADLFSWSPSERFDYVFFGFWFSHVPRSRFDDFWDLVGDALADKGRVFFIDSLRAQESTARDHAPVDGNGRAVRRLNDGREYEIVKEFYEPSELLQSLEDRGWSGYVRGTEHFFLYGCVSRCG